MMNEITVDIVTIDDPGDPAGMHGALISSLADVVVLSDASRGVDPRAIERLADVFADPDVAVAYSDESIVDRRGRHLRASYKPDWSPERFRTQFYIGDVLAVRRTEALAALLDIVTDDSYPTPRGTALRWDLVLRLTEHGEKVVHIPEILHRRTTSRLQEIANEFDSTLINNAAIVRAHCERTGIESEVRIAEPSGALHLRRALDPGVKVSLIIPTCGSTGTIWGQERIFILEFVQSILERSTWPSIEFVIVADTSTPDLVRQSLARLCGERLIWVEYDQRFNFSDKINRGRDAASGDVLLLLNDDMEVISEDFIEELAALALDPGVGAVGARLLLEDGRLQHIGHRYSDGTFHLFAGFDGDYEGPEQMCLVTRECIGVTAACLAIRAEVFDRLGGLSLDFPNNFNDVDLSLRLRELGLRNLVTPHATLFHFETVTRDGTVTPEEAQLLFRTWGTQLRSDPYSNPNLEAGRIEWIEMGTR